jgi:hypothetical protein
MISLSSEDTDVAPVKHPALVKTSDQQSFSFANFLPFNSAEALLSSDLTPSDTLSDSDTELVISFADDSTEEYEEQDADFVFCTSRFS